MSNVCKYNLFDMFSSNDCLNELRQLKNGRTALFRPKQSSKKGPASDWEEPGPGSCTTICCKVLVPTRWGWAGRSIRNLEKAH